jgi:hypothetical protein
MKLLSSIVLSFIPVMQSEEQIKKTNIIVAGVGLGVIALGGAAYIGMLTVGMEQQKEKLNTDGAETYFGVINRSVQAFYVEEGRFPQNFLELTNKYRGFSSAYVSGNMLEQLENSNMKISGYEFNMRLADQDTVHVSAAPLYKGNYPTISGGVFLDKSNMQAKGILCKSERFTNSSTAFPERDASGQLTCPSGYKTPR